MIRVTQAAGWLGGTLILLAAAQAQAGLSLCNRTSYRMQAAIGLEERANVVTRGWFRIDPGECKQVLDGGSTPTWSMYTRAPRQSTVAHRSRRPATPNCAFVTAISTSAKHAAV